MTWTEYFSPTVDPSALPLPSQTESTSVLLSMMICTRQSATSSRTKQEPSTTRVWRVLRTIRLSTSTPSETRGGDEAKRWGCSTTEISPLLLTSFLPKVPGEDVYHVAQYAKKLIPAMQGTDPLHLKTVATCKHFLAYGKNISPSAP
jgi:hypothetical protein